MAEFNFDDIRPYTEEEALKAIQRIVDQPELKSILEYLFGKGNYKFLIKLATEATSIIDFQRNFMYPLVQKILEETSGGLSASGSASLSNNDPRLFIANHRDITLDSSLLTTILVKKNLIPCEITWGHNLMVSPFVTDLGKINRMITVFRQDKHRDVLLHAQKLSAYIRKKIIKDKLSVWIAQQKGRTKDGNDKTNVGVLKMLSFAGEGNLIAQLIELNITPVSISYEWEPCDLLKVKEIYISQSKNYVKKQNEDLQSIISGISGRKGHIHLGLGSPINTKIQQIDAKLSDNTIFQQIAAVINIEIYKNYHLWPNNFVAYDLLHKSHQYINRYSAEIESRFKERMAKAVAEIEGDKSEIVKLFLKVYAEPVINKLKYKLPLDEPRVE